MQMFVKGMRDRPVPPGVNPVRNEDRMPVVKVVSGDTWSVDAELVAADCGPASPENSYIEFVLSENQFSPPIWTGEWMSGVLPDANRKGLVHVRIPREITRTLRRGSYMFSMRVGDRMRYSCSTQLDGNFLVEYMPTSDQHSIPYRDGTSEVFGGGSAADSVTESDGGSGVIDKLKADMQSLREEVSLLKRSKANKGEMMIGDGPQPDMKTIQLKEGMACTVITNHQDLSGKMDKDALAGKTYDFSKNRDIIIAGSDAVKALGGDVTDNPADQGR